jgi:hypothetical protein
LCEEEITVNKDSIKEKLSIISALIIILGAFLIGLFMLSNEELYFFGYSFGDLNQYTAGFLITGLIASIFGLIFTIICLDECEEAEINADGTWKKKC